MTEKKNEMDQAAELIESEGESSKEVEVGNQTTKELIMQWYQESHTTQYLIPVGENGGVSKNAILNLWEPATKANIKALRRWLDAYEKAIFPAHDKAGENG